MGWPKPEHGWQQRLRKLGKWNKWCGVSRYGSDAETQAQLCKGEWDRADSMALSVTGDGSKVSSDVLRYCFDKARKSDTLEAAALTAGHSGIGGSEWRRRCASSKFQICDAGKHESDGEVDVDKFGGDTGGDQETSN